MAPQEMDRPMRRHVECHKGEQSCTMASVPRIEVRI